MGASITVCVEKKNSDGDWAFVDCEPCGNRAYTLFGWLGDVRNYSELPPLGANRGSPDDLSEDSRHQLFYLERSSGWCLGYGDDEWVANCHSITWYTVEELLAFDYDQTVEDRRNRGPGDLTLPVGQGFVTTYRELFGPAWFKFLDDLKTATAERVIFGWD